MKVLWTLYHTALVFGIVFGIVSIIVCLTAIAQGLWLSR